MANIASEVVFNNGHAFPVSRKAFNRGLPRRIGAFEDQVERVERHVDVHDRRLDDLTCRLTEIEARPIVPSSDPGLAARVDNLVGAVGCLVEQIRRGFDPALPLRMDNIVDVVGRLADRLQRVDKRSSRTRRQVSVLRDQREFRFE